MAGAARDVRREVRRPLGTARGVLARSESGGYEHALETRPETPMEPEHEVDREAVLLDTSGLRCPEPLMLLRNRMRGLPVGATLRVIATDPASVRDFEQFCSFLGHRMLERDAAEDDSRFEFLIEKGEKGGTGGTGEQGAS